MAQLTVARPAPRMLRVDRLPIEILALLAGLLAWELIARAIQLAWLPPLSVVLAQVAFLLGSPAVRGDILSSLTALSLGFGISLAVGLPLGALMGRFRSVEAALDVYVNALLVAPTIMFVPIFFAVFGLSDATRVAVVVVFTVFVIVINTMTGIKTVDPTLIEMAHSFGASEQLIIRRVLLPGALPLVVAGISTGLARAIKGTILGEQLVAFVGLGALAEKYGAQFDMGKVFAISVLVLMFALVSNACLQVIDRRLTRWED